MDATTNQGGDGLAIAVRRFTDFLDSDAGAGPHVERIRELLDRGEQRLMVNVDHLRAEDAGLAADLLRRPLSYLGAFEIALQDVAQQLNSDLRNDPRRVAELRIGLHGAFGSHRVSPRGLLSDLVGAMVCVDGIVTRCSGVRPQLVHSVHYCPATNKLLEKKYGANTSLSNMELVPDQVYPTKDPDGNPLETEFGKCWFRDRQRVVIQEMPERAPPGQIPRSIDIILEQDLVDTCKPGDRVTIVGVYRAVGGLNTASGKGVFKALIWANAVQVLGQNCRGAISVSPTDVANIRKLAKEKKIFDILSRSIAPSISGLDEIKRALLLLLLGGVEKNLKTGTHLRGDINVLLVGDPSTAKSQLLRFILNTAPLAISTTGRGSSGVGLTAAVTRDQDTGERQLEAGAMVLADRGVVCIDEFDKMSDEDRVAIHEVMEQQTVTIAKAGVHASLNARCSVVAAANPLYGTYDRRKKPHENIALPDSLLSRFDLLFIILDMTTPERDRQIADHVLRIHQYRRPGSDAMATVLDDPDDENEELSRIDQDNGDQDTEGETSAVFEKRMRNVYGLNSKQKVVTVEFLKKFIHYAKSRLRPALTAVAAEYIAEKYRRLRQSDATRTLPITARCLETMIRLSTAHAKLRLSTEVSVRDARTAYMLVHFALYNQAEPEKKIRRKRREHDERVEEEVEEGNHENVAHTAGTMNEGSTNFAEVEVPNHPEANAGSDQQSTDPAKTEIARAQVLDALNSITVSNRKESCLVQDLMDQVQRGVNPPSRLTVEEVLRKLEQDQTIMIHDDNIFRI